MLKPPFRVVQPWGRDRGRQATEVSSHDNAAAAFAARVALERKISGGRDVAPVGVELLVVDGDGQIMIEADRLLPTDHREYPTPTIAIRTALRQCR